MKLAVFSHKLCWPAQHSPSGYATDGGFPFQMRALSDLFDETRLIVPCASVTAPGGLSPLTGFNLTICPLTVPSGKNLWRKLGLIFWLARNGLRLIKEVHRADAIHTPIPGDIGTIGMLLAFILRKPLFVRHCGNWFVQKTISEHFWKWFIERFAGGRNVMLATGGNSEPPSRKNSSVRWIFSTSLTERELSACHTKRDRPPSDRVRLIIACRQDMEKGTGRVIESLPYILKDFPAATLDVVGDGESLGRFKSMAATLGVSQRVTFHGRVDQPTVVRLLQQSDLFCYPTAASEGFPKVVLEALACGLPVVTTRVSVLPELIGSGGGILIDNVEPAAIARAVSEIVSDAETYKRMSASAAETAQLYSLERWRDTIAELLQAAWGKPLRCHCPYSGRVGTLVLRRWL
jgi:glycosyltransferase involved in cell wall biosynthesis